MGHRIHNPMGGASRRDRLNNPRVTVPIEVEQADARVYLDGQANREWAAQHGPLPGVFLGDNPCGITAEEDLGTIRRAVRDKRFAIPARTYEALGETMQLIVDESPDDKTRVSAAKVLVALDRANSEKDKHSEPQQVNITVITPETARQLSAEDLERRIAALEAEAG